ncbi:MAG: T9SS type A sorting domain-containing protein, partial [Bacteroidetes bacterium]|nr:T9SS type A sorting domain-containing protein [Bacteroidota bacterium]
TLGYFLGKSDKYLGLRIKAEGKNHYGWVRMDVSGDATSFVLKDHAYESIPDKSINAGDIAVGIESINRDETVIYSYRQNVIIKSEYKGVAIVYDLSGREVRRNDIRKGTNTMNLDVATNYYMVRVHTNRGSESKKVHIRAK